MRDAVAGSTWGIEIGLQSQASPYIFKQNPTIASGDWKRSIVTAVGSIGALTNLDNLPTVSPASSQSVSIILSAAETTAAGAGGHINIFGIDQAGAEWSDVEIIVDVVAVSLYSAVPAVAAGATGGLPTVDANNAVKVQSGTGSNQISLSSGLVKLAGVTHTGAVIPSVTTTDTATNLTNAPTNGDLTAAMKASVNTEADTALSDAGVTTTVTGRIDTNIASRMATFSYTAPPTAVAVRQEIDSNSTQLAKLGTPAGDSVSADIAALLVQILAILDDTGTSGVALSTAVKQAIADEVLKRGMVNVDSASPDELSLYDLIASILNGSMQGGVWTSHTSTGGTFAVHNLTTDADALPVTAVST